MRYIDSSSVIIPTDWLTLAKDENYSPLWSFLKTAFEDIIGKKCWYNETINDGSSNPIDHFRPKASTVKMLTKEYAVLEDQVWAQLNSNSRPGYSYLTHETDNYRYASGFVNSPHKRESVDGITRGKWDFFPLQLGSPIATSQADLLNETIALIDPCIESDPELLTFNSLGGIDPSDTILTHSWDYCRVKVSVEIYNLMYYIISDKRKELWEQCERTIEIATKLYNKPRKSDEELEAFDVFFIQLVKMLNKKSEYSSVAVDCVKFYKKYKGQDKYKWLNTIPANLLKK